MPSDADAVLARVVAFASEVTFDALPAGVVQAAKDRLVDSLGCAIGAWGCETARIGLAVAAPPARPDLAGRIVGTDLARAAAAAAFVNGCLVRDLDFNDTYPGGHPSDCLGALLAVAPVVGAGGRELITAMVIAYEIFIRLQMSGQFRERGWDNGFGIGVGAAAGLSRLLGLDRERMRDAVAISATANVPLRATRAGTLSLWKGAATAFSLHHVVTATQLAALGMTGPEAPLSGRHGVADLIAGPLDLKPFGNEGGEYYIPRAKLKYWPVAYQQQLLVWAGIELRGRLSGRELAAAHVVTNWAAWHESGSEPAKWDPRTRETADHSMPYILAWTLRHGSIGPEAFEEAAYLDPTLRPVMGKVTVTDDDELTARYPDELTMRVHAEDVDGNRHDIEVADPLGHEHNPLTTADIEAKFRRLCAPALGGARVDEALERWWAIEDHDVAGAMDVLVVPGAAGD